MPECYHCKQWVEAGRAHDCWTTTEAALTRELSEDLREAWQRLRETAASFGEQRIYASHNSIMFSRKACYFFVRPKRSFLEVCVFLGRTVRAPQIRRTDDASRTKTAHIIQIRHRDEVEAPVTDWLQEAYEYAGDGRAAASATARRPTTSPPPTPRRVDSQTPRQRSTTSRKSKPAQPKTSRTARSRRRAKAPRG